MSVAQRNTLILTIKTHRKKYTCNCASTYLWRKTRIRHMSLYLSKLRKSTVEICQLIVRKWKRPLLSKIFHQTINRINNVTQKQTTSFRQSNCTHICRVYTHSPCSNVDINHNIWWCLFTWYMIKCFNFDLVYIGISGVNNSRCVYFRRYRSRSIQYVIVTLNLWSRLSNLVILPYNSSWRSTCY